MTHQFSENPSACMHQFSENSSACTHQLLENPSACTHFFFASISSYTCVHRVRFDEVHTTFSDRRLVSITKPQEGFLCKMCLNSVFTQTTYTQDRFRHVHHMEIIPFRLTENFQPDLSLTVFLERFSDCSSLEFPNHLGRTLTEAPLSTITRLSWVLGSHSLAVCSWVLGSHSLTVCSCPFIGCFLFLLFYSLRNHFGSSLRHLLRVQSCKHTLCQDRHLDFRRPPRLPSSRGLLVTNCLVRDDAFSRTRGIFCRC